MDEIGGRGMDAGILTKTGEPHAIYHELKKLLREEWCTRASGKTADGVFGFRGFYGKYEIAIPGHLPVLVELTQEGPKKVDKYLGFWNTQFSRRNADVRTHSE